MLEQDWGHDVNGSRLGLLVFADNPWILARSSGMLKAMTQTWLDMLNEAGWQAEKTEMTWCSTLEDALPGAVRLRNDTLIRWAGRREGLKALGALLTFDGDIGAELWRRISSAWAAFGKHRHFLCCRAASLRERLRLLDKVVRPALFWCAGS